MLFSVINCTYTGMDEWNRQGVTIQSFFFYQTWGQYVGCFLWISYQTWVQLKVIATVSCKTWALTLTLTCHLIGSIYCYLIYGDPEVQNTTANQKTKSQIRKHNNMTSICWTGRTWFTCFQNKSTATDDLSAAIKEYFDEEHGYDDVWCFMMLHLFWP